MPSTASKTEANQHESNAKTAFCDPIEFINKSYRDFSLLDLQDALIAFSKSSNETKEKIDEIIPKNFAKFINCKGIMDKLRRDYKEKKLLNRNSDKDLSLVLQKLDSLIYKHSIKLEDDEGQEDGHTSLFSIRELKEILRSNILNFEAFVAVLKNENGPAGSYDISINQEVLDGIRPEIRDFLRSLYDRISNTNIDFDECCHLMDLYLYVCNFEKEYSSDQTKLKLINTMLVHFKEDTFNKIKASDEYYSYIFKSLNRILVHADESQGTDAIHHVFACLLRILKATDPKYARIVFRRIDDFRKSFKGPQFYIKEIKIEFSDLRLDVFKHFISQVNIEESIEIFDTFLPLFRDQDTRKAQELLAEKVQKIIMTSKLTGFEFIREYDRCLGIVKPSLGHAESKMIKNLEKSLRKRKDEEIQGISDKFLKLFSLENEDPKILMEAIRIIESETNDTLQIFLECKDKIVKRPVVLMYLHKYLRIESPILNQEEKTQVDQLKPQFGHLIGI